MIARLLSVLSLIDTNTGDDNSLEQRLYYNADVGRHSSERQQEVNREYVRVASSDV
jgi:hypothetical protein